uniref:Uncharacterized protein n=1 Tax=Anguilla anguilla TaxID=7936 RepID=A0A0E9PID3_ANGAN
MLNFLSLLSEPW